MNIWESALALMWAKSIILLFIVLTVKTLCRLCDTLEIPEEKKFVTGFLLTSVFMGSCIIVNSQYDIIISYFMLNALDCYIRRNRKGFLVYIAVSATIKPFAFFLYAPLILYAEKNVLKLAVNTVCACIPYVGFKILIPNHTQLVTYSTVLTLFHNKVTVAGADIPVFFLFSFILWMFCYLYAEPDEKSGYYRQVLMISYISFAIFFVFCGTNPYWCIMLIPFQGLILALNKKNALLGILLEMAASIGLLGRYFVDFTWCYGADLVRTSFVGKIFGMRHNATESVMDVLGNMSYTLFEMRDRISSLSFGLFVVATIGFIWLNFFEHKNIAMENATVSDNVFYARIAVSFMVCMIPMVLYIF